MSPNKAVSHLPCSVWGKHKQVLTSQQGPKARSLSSKAIAVYQEQLPWHAGPSQVLKTPANESDDHSISVRATLELKFLRRVAIDNEPMSNAAPKLDWCQVTGLPLSSYVSKGALSRTRCLPRIALKAG